MVNLISRPGLSQGLLYKHGISSPKRLEIALGYVIVIMNFLNLKEHHNRMTGSKVTAILLNGIAYWCNCIRKGLRLQPAQQAQFDLIDKIQSIHQQQAKSAHFQSSVLHGHHFCNTHVLLKHDWMLNVPICFFFLLQQYSSQCSCYDSIVYIVSVKYSTTIFQKLFMLYFC